MRTIRTYELDPENRFMSRYTAPFLRLLNCFAVGDKVFFSVEEETEPKKPEEEIVDLYIMSAIEGMDLDEFPEFNYYGTVVKGKKAFAVYAFFAPSDEESRKWFLDKKIEELRSSRESKE